MMMCSGSFSCVLKQFVSLVHGIWPMAELWHRGFISSLLSTLLCHGICLSWDRTAERNWMAKWIQHNTKVPLLVYGKNTLGCLYFSKPISTVLDGAKTRMQQGCPLQKSVKELLILHIRRSAIGLIWPNSQKEIVRAASQCLTPIHCQWSSLPLWFCPYVPDICHLEHAQTVQSSRS